MILYTPLISLPSPYSTLTFTPHTLLTDDRFRYFAATYNNTVTNDYAIYLFGGQTPYNEAVQGYELYDSVIRYVR